MTCPRARAEDSEEEAKLLPAKPLFFPLSQASTPGSLPDSFQWSFEPGPLLPGGLFVGLVFIFSNFIKI